MDLETVNVGKLDVTKRTSPIRQVTELNASTEEGGVCYWNGVAYSEGATICVDGNRMRCYADGTWSVTGTCWADESFGSRVRIETRWRATCSRNQTTSKSPMKGKAKNRP